MIITDATLAVTRRWRRNLLTATAVGVSAATVVILISFVHSAAARTAATLAGLSPNEITATLPGGAWATPEEDLVARLRDVAEITAVGTMILPDESVKPVDVRSARSNVAVRVGVAVGTEAGLRTRGATVVAGGYPSPAALRDRDFVLIGKRLASQLRIGDPLGAVVSVDGARLNVAGIVADGAGGGILSTSLILPPQVAERLDMLPPNRTIRLTVAPGSADALASWLPIALYPTQPGDVSVSLPPSPRELQAQLTAESSTWVNVITVVLIMVSAFTIMTAMQIAVQERRREIGVRRAMGTGAFRIGAQFCLEALSIGLFAGLLGACVGMIAIAGWAETADWVILVPPFLGFVPLGGLVVGGISGLVPAFVATRVDPAELLRTT